MTAGASRVELKITRQPALAPSPQPRPAPTARALPPKHAGKGGQNWTPIGGQIWKPIDTMGVPAWTPSAYAAAAARSPSGFADIVAKVKPAVISVRVKLDAPANKTSMNQNDDDDNATPFERGSPMEKFFRQFG